MDTIFSKFRQLSVKIFLIVNLKVEGLFLSFVVKSK